MEKLFFKNKEEWRAWLEKNHALSTEIWLVYFKKHTKKPTVTYNEAVDEALCFGWIDSTVKRIDEETYMQKYTPRKEKSMWSLVNTKKVEILISQDKMTKAGLNKINIAKKNGQWDKAYSTAKQVEMPKELETALKNNSIAFKNFFNFSPSNQKEYKRWVLAAKRPETIHKRIKVVIERSEMNIKPGML